MIILMLRIQEERIVTGSSLLNIMSSDGIFLALQWTFSSTKVEVGFLDQMSDSRLLNECFTQLN
jgi:phosphopantetheine adenylyltransferase